jgi:hypothetical protein
MAGSISYLAGEFVPVEQGLLYLALGSFVVSTVAVTGFLAAKTVGLLVVAVTLFYLSNGAVLLAFAGEVFLLPFPILGAIVGEVVALAARLRGFAPLSRSILVGGFIGALSYWMLYPFSFLYYDSAILPSLSSNPEVGLVIPAGITGGLLAANVNRHVAALIKKRYLWPT